jgi:hypothetical protein
MEKLEKPAAGKESSPPAPNHTEKIKTQLLAKIGKPPRLDRVEISRHHNGKYRVNIWQQAESDGTISVSLGSRVGWSYYLTVSEAGEILESNPPLVKLSSSA